MLITQVSLVLVFFSASMQIQSFVDNNKATSEFMT